VMTAAALLVVGCGGGTEPAGGNGGGASGNVEITFASEHRPIQAYVNALADADLLVERLRETDVPDSAIVRPRSRRWQRIPLFLHIRALKLR